VSHAVHDPAKVILEPTVTLATSEGTTWRTSRCRASTVRETVRLEATSPNRSARTAATQERRQAMTPIEVSDARQLLEVLDRKPVPRLALTSALLGTAEAARWERRLNGLLDNCGCDAGAVGFLTGLTVSLVVVLWREAHALSPLAAAAAVLAAAVGTAVAGKALGRQRSRRRARREGMVLVGILSARETATTSPVPRWSL